MIQSNEMTAAREAAKASAEAIVFDPTHTRGGPEGGCLTCDAQGTALARVCAAVLRNEDPRRCPACGIPVALVGNVFCESGEYDDSRGEYAAEGDAAVYACKNGHSFAWNPPCEDQAEDLDDTFCPTCRMNVGADHNDAACQAEYEA